MRSIESRVVSPVLFKVREMLDKGPTLDAGIKIFGVDDASVSQLERTELTPEEWVNAIELLDRSEPRAIIIDAMFSQMNISKAAPELRLAERMKAIKAPIYTGLFSASGAIKGREPIDLNDDVYSLASYLDQETPFPGTKDEQLAKISIGRERSLDLYGSHPAVRPFLQKGGHIHYGDDEGSYYPFHRLKDNHAVPQIMLRPFNDVKFSQDRLIVDGGEIFLSGDGKSPVNYLPAETMTSHVNSILALTQKQAANARLSFVKKGDFVFLIPLYHTGNVDLKPTPVGLIPGAFLHLSVLNSILQKSQLKFMDVESLLILGFAAAIAYFGWWMGPFAMVISLFLSTGVWIATCLLGFAYQNVIFPFLLPQLSIAGVGMSLLLQRIYIAERKARLIRSTLEGVVRPEALKMLQRNPEKLSLDARERVVTIVFIDIVGFSLMVENQQPRVAFEGLQRLVESMTDCIHKHGGIVNKTLGDGILCFFGYSLEDNKEVGNHAEEALAAAIEIQTSNLPRVMAAEGRKDAVFPLRIGINTSAVFMGNLGAGERLDITVIGNGVNFAKRLEAACEAHAVLVGSTTHDLIVNRSGLVTPTRKLISIKHHDEKVESWEYDPLSTTPGLRARAEAIYEISAEIHRRVRRWDMDSDVKIAVNTGYGIGQIINFWDGGFKFELDTLINRGTLFQGQLDSSDGVLHRQLAKQGLANLKLEVQIVETIDGKFIHHIRTVGLDPRQQNIVLDLLEQFGPKQEIHDRNAS